MVGSNSFDHFYFYLLSKILLHFPSWIHRSSTFTTHIFAHVSDFNLVVLFFSFCKPQDKRICYHYFAPNIFKQCINDTNMLCFSSLKVLVCHYYLLLFNLILILNNWVYWRFIWGMEWPLLLEFSLHILENYFFFIKRCTPCIYTLSASRIAVFSPFLSPCSMQTLDEMQRKVYVM